MADKKKNKEVKESKPAKVVAKKNSNKLLPWICAAAIAVITYFVFSPSMDDGFTNWDDNVYVSYNPLVVNNSVPLVEIFETPVSANYHPLTVLSFALNYQFGKLDPSGYHAVNVFFHILNTILVFLFIFLLTRRNLLMAAIVSLFFGIHPMHVESVTWISERKDVLYVFFFMAGLITYLRYSETKKIGWYIFTFLLFILSCLSKGMAVVFPVILLLIDYLRKVKWERRLIIEKIPFFLLALVFGIIAINTQKSAIDVIKNLTIFQRLLFACYGAIIYIVKLFIPFKLSAFYPYPKIYSIPMIYYLSPFIILGISAALIYFFLKKEKEIVFGLLFYFVSVALVLQFISVGAAIMADRYSYLSYIGLFFIVAYLINKIWQTKNTKWALMKYPIMLIAITGAVTFSYQAYLHTQVWKNSETLWTDVIEKYPNAAMAYYNRGNYYYVNNEMDKAMSDYTTALQVDSLYRDDYYNRGILYATYNKDDLAIADYTKAIALDSTKADAHTNRGLLYSKGGKNDLAIADYTKAIALDSSNENAYKDRGVLFLNTGKMDLALADFNKIIILDSTNADVYSDIGLIYLNTGKIDLAINYYNTAIALNPNSPIYYYNRGLCYKILNQYKKAADDFTKTLQLNLQNAVVYNVRGVCYTNLQNYNEAINDFSKAIEINPSVPDYWLNRSFAESKMGQNEMAKADALKTRHLQGK